MAIGQRVYLAQGRDAGGNRLYTSGIVTVAVEGKAAGQPVQFLKVLVDRHQDRPIAKPYEAFTDSRTVAATVEDLL